MPPELNDLSEAAANIHCRCALLNVSFNLSYLHNINTRIMFTSVVSFLTQQNGFLVISISKAFHNLKNTSSRKLIFPFTDWLLMSWKCTVKWNNWGDYHGEFQRETIVERLSLPHFALQVLWYEHWLVHGMKCIQVVQFTSSTNICLNLLPVERFELFFYFDLCSHWLFWWNM